MTSYPIRLAILGVLIAVACAVLAITTLVADDDDPGVSPNALLSSNRSNLQVCVAVVDSAIDLNERNAEVEGLLAEIVGQSNAPADYKNWQVANHCPQPTALTGTPTDATQRQTSLTTSILIGRDRDEEAAEPSAFRVIVYFVADEAYSASFLDEGYASTVAEYLCTTGLCVPVTGAVYVPASADANLLRAALIDALGLRAPEPKPTLDWGSCEREEPQPEIDCSRYEDFLNE